MMVLARFRILRGLVPSLTGIWRPWRKVCRH